MNDVRFDSIEPRKKSGFKKFLGWFFVILFLVLGLVFWWKYYYVFGEGVKSGELNYVVKKGNVFKTYEGKLIQSGLRSKAVGSVQSYEFEFSVVNDSIAKVLMENSGSYFDLHYKEYKNTLPWRGFSPYIVDGILKMEKVAR
ncbi:MAG: hypothetical protein EOO13_00330 [Chitinophagaceae bacterium]|nr:MAG: hypothetical protein EOO13_00330 [Chitinophagaceae bacterium]